MRMHDETLARLYQQRPNSKDILGKASGYAVFSNVNAQYFIVGGGGGYGVAVSHVTGQKIFMKMAQVDLGPGLGAHDIRVIFVFHSQRAMDAFVYNGWEISAQADAVATARDKGSAANGEISIDAETTMYAIAEAGLMAKVNLAGSKYWLDDSLNY